jgi:hypothetical protein
MHNEWCTIKLVKDPGRMRRGAPDPQFSKKKSRAMLFRKGGGFVSPAQEPFYLVWLTPVGATSRPHVA